MTTSSPRRSAQMSAWVVALYALLAAAYFVLRYAARWTDSDTANLTVATAAVLKEGTLVPSSEGYSHGFLYQSVSVFIASLSGVELPSLQLCIYPPVAAGLSLVAFVLYRELAGDAVAGALAILLLFAQPDFLFVIFRGSHEKTTWLMAMLAMFLLARSFRAMGKPASFAVHVVLFYAAALAVISSNAFFGSSFILAMVVSLLAGLMVQRIVRKRSADAAPKPIVTRLLYVVAAAMVIWFLELFYLYRPALGALIHLERALDKAAAVALGSEPKFDPYATVGLGWVSLPAYLGLIMPSWIVGACSFVLWARAGKRFLGGEEAWQEPPQFLLWLLYGGFGVQLALAIGLDQTGAIGGNLQQRFLPVVMLMAFPIVAKAIVQFWHRRSSLWQKGLLAIAVCLFMAWASAVSLLKATNDPWLSNYWLFRSASEIRSRYWANDKLQHRSIWYGLDGARLGFPRFINGEWATNHNWPDTYIIEQETRDIISSLFDAHLSIRRKIPMPDVRIANRVYDNGTVAQYHLRPRTPYQK